MQVQHTGGSEHAYKLQKDTKLLEILPCTCSWSWGAVEDAEETSTLSIVVTSSANPNVKM